MFRSIFFFGTLILFLIVGNLYATNYYVSTTSSGTANANSWTNKKIITSFTWTSLSGGDTVFVDGGTDSLTYHTIWLNNVNPTTTVVVTKGKDAGHNGKVIIDVETITDALSCAIFLGGTTRNIKLTGLTFKNVITTDDWQGTNFYYVIRADNCSNLIIDNCDIISKGVGSCVYLNTCTNVTITNNRIEVLTNSYESEADCIHISSGYGFNITGNAIITGASAYTGSHKDLIQFYNVGDVTKPLLIIANNFLLCTATNQMMTGINTATTQPNRWLIYNNIISLQGVGIPILFYDDATHTPSSLKLLNNTIINTDSYTMRIGNVDTVIIKNNIIYKYGTTGNANLWFYDTHGGFAGITDKEIDYNIYYRRNTSALIDTGYSSGVNFNLTTWKALGYDTHSLEGAPTFANLWGTAPVDYELNSGSSGIDVGTSLSTIFSTDYFGTSRPQGAAFDIGAFETAVASSHYYYVSNNGNDANSGTSTSTSWKTISKVNSISFNPGDNILFRRGDTWSEILTPQGSGNASNPITYDAYGTGNLPIIDGGTTRNNCISIIGVNYITIRNFRVQNAAVNTTGNIHVQNADHIRIENCDCYITSHGGVLIESSTNAYIGYCTMSSPVSNNNNQADGIYSQRNSNCIYENNSIVISDMGTGHNDGIQSYLDTDMTFRNNYIYQNNSLTLAQGIDISDGAGTFYVYNNVVKCPNSNGNIIGFNNDVSGTGALRCYQNTVLGNVYCLRILKCADVSVKNNIFYSNNTTPIIDIGATLNSGSEIDYNLYNRSGSGSMVLYEPQGYMTYAQWQATGYETHGINTNPVVNDTLCPAINSPVINVGINLGGIYRYDKEGTLRPVNGVDLGAYELKSTPTPVELTSFTGNLINNSVHLTWSTATETNNQGFDIEKNNSSSWVKIGFIEGKGNSATKNDYLFEDKNPTGYTIQYRLKQIDNNGNFKYSDVVTITVIPKDFSIGNYPNPFNPSTKIRYTIPSESMINLVIYNIIGERIDELKNEQQQPGTYEINWNGSGHPSGIYLLSIIESPVNGSAKNSKTIKMNLIK